MSTRGDISSNRDGMALVKKRARVYGTGIGNTRDDGWQTVAIRCHPPPCRRSSKDRPIVFTLCRKPLPSGMRLFCERKGYGMGHVVSTDRFFRKNRKAGLPEKRLYRHWASPGRTGRGDALEIRVERFIGRSFSGRVISVFGFDTIMTGIGTVFAGCRDIPCMGNGAGSQCGFARIRDR